MNETRLDRAHAAMAAAPGDEQARLAFYDRMAESELFLLLEADVSGDAPIAPRTFALESGPLVVAFDSEDRLATFASGPAPFAALSGRNLAAQLAGQGVALGLNFGTASEILLPAEAIDWLATTLASRPERIEARLAEVATPTGLPDSLLTSLGAKLAATGGLGAAAYLAAATRNDGGRGHLLAFVDVIDDAQPALVQAVAEALALSGLEAASLDVAFVRRGDPVAARLARVALRIDLPQPRTPAVPAPPGGDPNRPPRLR